MAAKPKKASEAKANNEAQRYLKKVREWVPKTVMLFVLAVFFLHPLYMDNTGYFFITEAKQSFFAVLAVLLFFIMSLFSFTIPGFYKRLSWKGFVRGMRPYEWALLAYALVMIASTCFADSKRIAILGGSSRNEGLLMMFAYFGVCALVGRFYKPKEWMLYVLCGTAALVALYGVGQYYGFDPLGLYPVDYGTQTGRSFIYFATMSNRNVASTYFCLAFCISIVMFSQQTKKIHWAFLPLGLLMFYGLLIGKTESGYLGLAVSIAIAFPFITSTRQTAARFFLMLAGCLGVMWLETAIGVVDANFASYWAFMRPYLPIMILTMLALAGLMYFVKLPPLPTKASRIAWYALLIVLVILLVSALPQLAEVTGNRSLVQLEDILQGNLDDSYMSGRMMPWKRALSMIPDRLLLGYGPDNFTQSFNVVNYKEIFAAQGVGYDKLHNEYLQVLFDNGLLGFLSLLGFYGALLYAACKKVDKPIVLSMALALLCHMVQAFFNFVSPFAHPVAWTLWGVFGALLYENGQSAAKKQA